MKYVLINQILYWRDLGGMLLRYLDSFETDLVATKLHEGVFGGHKYWKETTFNILRAGYY